MTSIPRIPTTVALFAALLVADSITPAGLGLIGSPAQAVVGRPLTPVSGAGVARRTTRRTVAATAAVAPKPAPVVVVAPPPQAAAPVTAAPAAPPPPPPK